MHARATAAALAAALVALSGLGGADACDVMMGMATTTAALTFTVPPPTLQPRASVLMIKPTEGTFRHNPELLIRPAARSPGKANREALSILKVARTPGKARYDRRRAVKQSQTPKILDGGVRMVNGVDYGPYMKRLETRLRRAWVRPAKYEYFLPVVTTFQLMKNGEMLNIRVAKTSGNHMVDDAALQALSFANPVKPLPKGAPAYINVRFVFENYNGSSCCCGGGGCTCLHQGSCGGEQD